jgi:hypothetical protein
MKRKSNLNKNTHIVVKFYPSTDKEINKLLKSLNLSGVRVSNLISRWSIDVPFWKENYFAEKLAESELVEKIYRNPSRREIYERVEEEQQDG